MRDLNDFRSYYDPLIKQIAELYPEDVTIQTHLQTLVVTAEEWDDGGGGGHLAFQSSLGAAVEVATIDAWAQDSDGMPIEIILHTVDGRVTWGEWYRVDGGPIQCWPPRTLQRTSLDLQ